MTPNNAFCLAIYPALTHLRRFDERLYSKEAAALLLAIDLQESALRHRRQVKGPARGLPQFELAGVNGVQRHPSTRVWAAQLLNTFLLDHDPESSLAAIEYNDVYASCMARLALWPDPEPLPGEHEVDAAGMYYLRRWRPGRPRMKKWESNYARAWQCLNDVWETV